MKYFKKFEENRYDHENPNAYKIALLQDMDIKEIENENRNKYGKFKIERKEVKNSYAGRLIEHIIADIFYLEENDQWYEMFSHNIYDWEVELDHGKEREYQNLPLVKILFVDIERELFYVESEEGYLYCSSDKLNWFRWWVKPKDRPYYGRIDKLRKISLPN